MFDYKGFKINLHILDSAGQEKYRAIIKNYFNDTDGIFIVFDLTNKYSFNNLKIWIDIIKECKGNDYSNIVILGNKSDLEDIYQVFDEDIENFKREYNIDIMKTSAKNGNGVKDAIHKMIDLNFGNKTEEEIYQNFCKNYSMKLILAKDTSKKSKSHCC